MKNFWFWSILSTTFPMKDLEGVLIVNAVNYRHYGAFKNTNITIKTSNSATK
jgi:hypothetical protein